jgi:hypothetical protein
MAAAQVTLEQLLQTMFSKFYTFITTQALPSMQHPKLDSLAAMPIEDVAHHLRMYLLPLRDEFNMQPAAVAGQAAHQNDVGLLDYLLLQLDSTYTDAVRKMTPAHLSKLKQFLECFIDILTNSP